MDASTATGSEGRSWPQRISAIALFVEDLAAAKQFYSQTFRVPILFEDNDAVMFKVGTIFIKLLNTTAAGVLYEPAAVATSAAGCRFVLTLPVDDVDAMCKELAARGVELLNGPMDRPWGVRTASFGDPAGHIWEIAKVIEEE